MVHVYGMCVEGLPDPKEHPELMKDFSLERKEKTLRYLQAKDRRQSLGAGLLLNRVLQRHGFCMDDMIFGEHGKPEISGLCFNMSHSHDYVICVVSDKAVGCDIEKVGKLREKMAERYFTDKEAAFLNAFKEEEKTDVFYRIWTMKESYVKMTGEGIQLGFKRCEFQMDDSVNVYRDGALCDCFIKEYPLDGYKVAICAQENTFSNAIEFLDLMEK